MDPSSRKRKQESNSAQNYVRDSRLLRAEESGTAIEGSPQAEWNRIVKTYHAAATSTRRATLLKIQLDLSRNPTKNG